MLPKFSYTLKISNQFAFLVQISYLIALVQQGDEKERLKSKPPDFLLSHRQHPGRELIKYSPQIHIFGVLFACLFVCLVESIKFKTG